MLSGTIEKWSSQLFPSYGHHYHVHYYSVERWVAFRPYTTNELQLSPQFPRKSRQTIHPSELWEKGKRLRGGLLQLIYWEVMLGPATCISQCMAEGEDRVEQFRSLGRIVAVPQPSYAVTYASTMLYFGLSV